MDFHYMEHATSTVVWGNTVLKRISEKAVCKQRQLPSPISSVGSGTILILVWNSWL